MRFELTQSSPGTRQIDRVRKIGMFVWEENGRCLVEVKGIGDLLTMSNKLGYSLIVKYWDDIPEIEVYDDHRE